MFPISGDTNNGTSVAASYHGNCKSCKKTYYYSYYEEYQDYHEHNDKHCNQRRVYYDIAVDLPFFQVSNKTFFEKMYILEIVNNIELCGNSFEFRADVYNLLHRECDNVMLRVLENFARIKNELDSNI